MVARQRRPGCQTEAPPDHAESARAHRATNPLRAGCSRGRGADVHDREKSSAGLVGLRVGLVGARFRRAPSLRPSRSAPSAGARRCSPPGVRFHCRFAVQLNHFIPGFLSYSVAVFLKRQSDLSLSPPLRPPPSPPGVPAPQPTPHIKPRFSSISAGAPQNLAN